MFFSIQNASRCLRILPRRFTSFRSGCTWTTESFAPRVVNFFPRTKGLVSSQTGAEPYNLNDITPGFTRIYHFEGKSQLVWFEYFVYTFTSLTLFIGYKIYYGDEKDKQKYGRDTDPPPWVFLFVMLATQILSALYCKRIVVDIFRKDKKYITVYNSVFSIKPTVIKHTAADCSCYKVMEFQIHKVCGESVIIFDNNFVSLAEYQAMITRRESM